MNWGDQQEADTQAAWVREALGAGAFTTAWNAGRVMTLGEAVEDALAEE